MTSKQTEGNLKQIARAAQKQSAKFYETARAYTKPNHHPWAQDGFNRTATINQEQASREALISRLALFALIDGGSP